MRAHGAAQVTALGTSLVLCGQTDRTGNSPPVCELRARRASLGSLRADQLVPTGV